MPNRTRVPAKLHSELTEYSQLLKTLRTNRTLDLSYHLSQYANTTQVGRVRDNVLDEDSDVDVDDELDGDGDDDETRVAGPSGLHDRATSPPMTSDVEGITTRAASVAQNQSSSPRVVDDVTSKLSDKSKGKQSAHTSTNKRRRGCGSNDTWTRWPLLAGDVHEPEWSLEDEVRLIAETALRMLDNERAEMSTDGDTARPNHPSPSPSLNEVETNPPDEEPAHTPSHPLSPLPQLTSTHLHRILAALSHQHPLVERSLYQRLRPMNWEQVLSCVGACGLASPRVLDRAQKRLEAIYGPSHRASPAHRASHVLLAARKRDELHKRAFDDIFALQGPPTKPAKARARARAKSRKRATTQKK